MLWFKRRPVAGMPWFVPVFRFLTGSLTEEETAVLRMLPNLGTTEHRVVTGRLRTVCRRLARMGYAKRTKWAQGGIRMYQRTPEGAALVTPPPAS